MPADSPPSDSLSDSRQNDCFVLIIDDNADDCEACMRALKALPDTNYKFEVASSAAAGMAAFERRKPDVVLLDYFLPGSNGLEVLIRLKALRPDLPVIILTGSGSETLAAQGMKAGASNYLNKTTLLPFSKATLTSASADTLVLHRAITAALSEHARGEAQLEAEDREELPVLIIDDNADDRETCIRALRKVRKAGYRFIERVDGRSGLEAVEMFRPAVVLLDYSLPGVDGLDVLAKIRQSFPFLPVIILTGHGDEGVAVRGIKGGAFDYFVKGTISAESLDRAIISAIEHHRAMRTIDEQTRMIQAQREKLESSNHFLNNLLNHIPDPIFVKDSSHRWLMVNQAFRDLIDAAPLPSSPLDPSVCDMAADAFWGHDNQVLDSGSAKINEQILIGPDGEPQLFSIKRATFQDADGVGVLVGVMRDITAQREAEENFKRQAAQLLIQSRDLISLGTILEESQQELLIVDEATLTILQANKGARRNLGYTQEELLQTNFLQLLSDFGEQKFRNLMTPLATGNQYEVVYHCEFRRKNGSRYDVEVHTQPTVVKGRSAFVQIAIDESERKQIEKMKTEFISTVSHELRTPLTSIRGALGLVCSGSLGALPEKVQRMIAIAQANSERLAVLVNDILALEKSNSGALSIHLRDTKVTKFLSQAVENCAGFAARYNVLFVLETVAEDLTVIADPGRLMQVLANLMSNAAKFSPPGSNILLRAFDQGANIRFEVEDHGCGIPEDFRPRIFDKFTQADSSIARRHEGTGLGLAITKQLVEAMGGQLGFDSKVDQGTTFFFHLPNSRRDDRRPSAREAMRVLICEDDADSALLLRMAIEQAGFETETASTVAEARSKLQDGAFDMLSLDLELPDAQGLDFLRELRLRPATEGMPVIVVSARDDAGGETFYGDPANLGWIRKPVNNKLLIEALRKAMLRSNDLPLVLYVGGDTAIARALVHSLEGIARFITVRDMRAVYQELRSRRFALIVCLGGDSAEELHDHVESGAEDMPPMLVFSESELASDDQSTQSVAASIGLKIAAALRPELTTQT